MSDITLSEKTTFTGSRIILPRLVDGATLSASSEESENPVENIQTAQRTETWRATGCDEEYIDIDFGCQRQVASLSLTHNMSYYGELEIWGSHLQGDDAAASGTFDAWPQLWGAGEDAGEHGAGGYLTDDEKAALYPAGPVRHLHFAIPSQARRWRIYFRDPDNPDGYIEIGRLALDYAFESARGASVGSALSRRTLGATSRSRGGQTWNDPHKNPLTGTLVYQRIPMADAWARWYNYLCQIGEVNPFFADFFPGLSEPVLRSQNQTYCHIPKGAMAALTASYQAKADMQLMIEESL